MTTQLINEATYNAFTLVPVAARTAEMQEQIEAYEAHHSLNVDADEHASESPVEISEAPVVETDTNTQPIVQDTANDESEASEWTVEVVEQDVELAEQMNLSLAVLDDQLFIADQRYKHFLALAAKATCLVKWTGPFILDVRVNDETKDLDFAKHVANTFGLLSFKHLLAESVLNKEIKEQQLKHNYVTVCSVPLQAKRDSAVPKYDEVKRGCQFVIHTEALKYVHNDYLNIAKLENVVTEKEGVTAYTDTCTPILRVRLNQQEWIEKNKDGLADLVAKLNTQHKAIAPKVKTDTFKAWSGILVLALLWDKAIFDDMVKLMNEFVGTQGLEAKVKLACALSVVVPEYEALVSRFKAEHTITTKLIGNLVKGLGLTDNEVSEGFTALGLPMGDNKKGYALSTLKNKSIEHVKYEDQSIQTYLTKLQTVETAQAA